MEDKKNIDLLLTFQGKSVAVETNPYNTIERFIEETKKQAKENPDKLFNMPELDKGDNPLHYRLTRVKNGKNEILKSKNKQNENQTLDDYGVKDGDELIIVVIPKAG